MDTLPRLTLYRSRLVLLTALICFSAPIDAVLGQNASPPGGILPADRSPSDIVASDVVPAAATGPASIMESAQQASRALPTPVPAGSRPIAPAVTPAEDVEPEEPELVASSPDLPSRALQSVIIRAIDELEADSLPDFEPASVALKNAIFELENFVGRGTQRGIAWAKFLELEAIAEELEADSPNANKFTQWAMNMRQNYAGLEMPQYVRVRDGLDRVAAALKYGGDPERTIRLFTARMRNLVETLDEPPQGAASDRASDIGLVTSYLVESGQVPWAVQQIRGQYSRPNLQVYARESLLNRLLMQPVAQPSPVNECLLGTRVVGNAFLQGGVSVDVLPMQGGVSMNLNMSAVLSTNNTGYNRGVVLRTTGSSPVFASKQIFVTPAGISAAPATVATNLMTQINAIEHRFRIVRRIAKKKAAETKPQADQIAEGRMQNKVRSQYDQRVEQQLSEARGKLSELQQKQYRPELKRLAIEQPTLAVYSTSDTVNADVVQAASFQLAAAQPCNIRRPSSSDVVFEVHQSLAINTLESFLGGRTIRSFDLDDLAKQFLGEVPPEIQKESDGDAWTISMASHNPVQLEFDENLVKLTLRITRMEGNDRELPRGAIISVQYSPSYRQGVLTLTRQGELEIDIPGVRSAIQATSLRSVVKTKFDPIFKETIQTEKIDLAAALPNAPKFVVNWIKIDDGWLQVGVK